MKSKNLIIALLGVTFGCNHSSAQLAVVVAEDVSADLRWAMSELPQWIQALEKYDEQIKHAKDMIDIAGHPAELAGYLMGMSDATAGETLLADALKTKDEVTALTRETWTVYTDLASLPKDALQVPKNYKVFGQDFSRDPERYMRMALENAQRVRLQQAADNKRAVDQKELGFQKATIDALRRAKTTSEIQLNQAALAASKQRMDLADARMRQAETELNATMQDNALNQRLEREKSVEWSEAFRDMSEIRSVNAISVGGAPNPRYVPPYHYPL